jgi:hypothetical protein
VISQRLCSRPNGPKKIPILLLTELPVDEGSPLPESELSCSVRSTLLTNSPSSCGSDRVRLSLATRPKAATATTRHGQLPARGITRSIRSFNGTDNHFSAGQTNASEPIRTFGPEIPVVLACNMARICVEGESHCRRLKAETSIVSSELIMLYVTLSTTCNST